MTRGQLARVWLLFGCGSLLLSGLLALVIMGAKLPFVKTWIGNLDWIRWGLVVHVNLANLVWFTSIPVALVHLSAEKDSPRRQLIVSTFGLLLSLLGVFLLMTSFPGPGVEVVLSNYIPVVTHPRFKMGIVFYFIGVVFNYLSVETLLPRQSSNPARILGLSSSRFGIWIGGLFFLLATLVLLMGIISAKKISFPSEKIFYETALWGGGHLLQHSSSVFLVTIWTILISVSVNKEIFSRTLLFPVFAWLGLPILLTPLLLFSSITSNEYREGFSLLMRWGIAPPILLYLALIIFRTRRLRPRPQFDAFSLAVVWSIVLILLGFIFGSLIRGSDMRVPAHYHATIGAVTIAFMAFSFQRLIGNEESASATKYLKSSIWIYGIGQSIFCSGMFIAGSYGFERKTYGSEIQFLSLGQKLGFILFGSGGLIAFLGGGLFAIALLKGFRILNFFKKE